MITRFACASIPASIALISSVANAQSSSPPPAPITLTPSIFAGPAFRADDAPDFDTSGRAGAVLGVSVFVAPTKSVAIGLSFEHTWLDRETGTLGDVGGLEIRRQVNALWADFRLTFFRIEDVGFHVSLGPGLAWQNASATGFYKPSFYEVPATFACSGSASANIGLRAHAGASFAFGDWLVVAEAGPDMMRLNNEPLDGCVPGAGTTVEVGVRGSIGYAFDITRFVR